MPYVKLSPAGEDDVIEFASLAAFPATGAAGLIYVAKDTNKIYRWSASGGTEASAFLARTSGLDATHTNAYTALIDGLVADGLWDKLDMLHVYATQDTATAQLNLVSTSYPATLVGTPTFTSDRGFTGTGSSQINTGFDLTSAVSPKYTQNSAHLSAWSVTDIGVSSSSFMGASGSGWATIIHTKDGSNNATFYCNGSTSSTVTNATPTGHYICNRPGSSSTIGYKNGSAIVTNNSANSTTAVSTTMRVLGTLNNGTPNYSTHQAAMASIGASLDATQAANFYNRLRTYMTAVGVP